MMKKARQKMRFIHICLCVYAAVIGVTIPGFSQTGQGERIVVSGTVFDATSPIAGATVALAGTTTAVVTDANGHYTITVTGESSALNFSFIGYVSQTVTVGAQTVIDITLKEDSTTLEDVVVVGYGTQKKANLTGAVDQVSAEVFENRPISNASQGLVGVLPNLNIRLSEGSPDESPSYNVRGTTSIGQGGSALVLIDGVEGDPAMINPEDIESVSLLKDAASASIYGARAVFGVVLITTQKAGKGRTSVSYSGNFAVKAPTAIPDNVVESYPWAQAFADAWINWNDTDTFPTAINKTLPFSQAYLAEIKRRWEDPSLPRVEVDPVTGQYQYYYSTDWYKELYAKNFFTTDQNITVSGGSDTASFYISGRYNHQDGLYRYNPDVYNMYNLRAKGDVQLTKWLKAENNTEYSVRDYHEPLNVGEGNSIWRNIADEGPVLAPLLNPDGTLTFPAAYTVGDRYLGRNAIDQHRRVLSSKTGLLAEFLPDKSLTLRVDFTIRSTDNDSQRNRVQVPYSRYQGVIAYTGSGTNDLQQQSQTTEYIATNIYTDWYKTLGRAHNLHLLVGYNYEQSMQKTLTATRNGILYDDVHDINLATGSNITATGGYTKWRIAGGFFRVNYDFDNRYLFEINGRYDGSSKFPEGSQWAFFPSVSAGWRITEEPFWNVDPKAVSNIKLRASYGSLGNGNIGAYRFAETFSIGTSGRIIGSGRPQQTGQPSVIPASLTWETATTGNMGLDITALDGRLDFTGDVYRRWTTDMFTAGPALPEVFGATVPQGNYADLRTTGFEISISWRDRFMIADKPFDYSVRFSLADQSAEITKFNNPDKNLAVSQYYEGMKIGEIWGYQVEGLFHSQEEIADSPSQGTYLQNTNTRKNYPGDLKFRNLDGDDIIGPGQRLVGRDTGDMTIIGNREARYSYGINLDGEWNGISVSAFFQGVMKQDYYPSGEAPFWGKYNRPYNQLPQWHADNMFREDLQNFDAYLPRLVGYTAQGGNKSLSSPNDRFLQNVAYIRLRNLQIGYNLPERWASAISATGIRVYFSAENLFTWSPMYKWTRDTDVTSIYGSHNGGNSGDGYNYPMLKALSLGLNVRF